MHASSQWSENYRNFDESFDISTNVKYCLMPGRYLGQNYKNIYSDIYQFWRSQWLNVFQEIHEPFSGGSEEFCRHEEVTCLLYKNKVVASALLDYFDINNSVYCKHSYFSYYPEEVIEKIKDLSEGKPIFTLEYLAVDPEFRKKFHFSEIIFALAVHRLQESNSSVMICCTRNSRKINELSYKLGAKPITQNYMVHGEPADFLYFNKSASMPVVSQHETHGYVQKLWDEKLFIPSLNISNHQFQS